MQLFRNSKAALTLPTHFVPFHHLLDAVGAPRAHWPEIVLAESSYRTTLLRLAPPILGDLLNDFYQHFTLVELKKLLHQYETMV